MRLRKKDAFGLCNLLEAWAKCYQCIIRWHGWDEMISSCESVSSDTGMQRRNLRLMYLSVGMSPRHRSRRVRPLTHTRHSIRVLTTSLRRNALESRSIRVVSQRSRVAVSLDRRRSEQKVGKWGRESGKNWDASGSGSRLGSSRSLANVICRCYIRHWRRRLGHGSIGVYE